MKHDVFLLRKSGVSRMRGAYLARLAARLLILSACFLTALWKRESFLVLQGWNFFRRFTPLHILWAIWMADMAPQLFPIRANVALGSQKHFAFRFRPAKWNPQALRRYTVKNARAALYAAFLWGALLAAIWTLRFLGALDDTGLFLVTALFYVCDLVCVLIWCPFRLILGNRCCTTCRIFNWDHFMMFSPMLPIRGFFSFSLIAVSVGVCIFWEFRVLTRPERFWEGANVSLRCSHCTDKLCTQYCGKRGDAAP